MESRADLVRHVMRETRTTQSELSRLSGVHQPRNSQFPTDADRLQPAAQRGTEWLVARRSSLVARRSSLVARRSSLVARRSSLVARRSSLERAWASFSDAESSFWARARTGSRRRFRTTSKDWATLRVYRGDC
jgi:hypothetical protein